MAEYIEREVLQNLFNEVSTSLLSRGELAKDAEHMVRAFLMVTEMIQDAPAADVAPVRHGMWISVKDRLPEPTYCVLVVGAYGEMEVDALGTDGEWMGMVEDVTHWMPLPKPPKGDTGNE